MNIHAIRASKWNSTEKYKATSIVIWSKGASYELIDDHDQDCCEDVYADWEHMAYYPSIPSGKAYEDLTRIQLEGDITSPDFIEPVEGVGFKIKCEQGYILVSCYNIQNGYYSSDLAIVCKKEGEKLWSRDISNCLSEDDPELA